MKLIRLKLLLVAGCFLFFSEGAKSQDCIPTGIEGRVIDLLCSQVCSTLVFQIPHIKGTDDYVVNPIAYNPHPFTVAGSNEITTIYVDDNYGPVETMPMNFCFYGAIYNQFVVGSNGLLTFDLANQAPCGNSYNQSFPIPYISSNICSSNAAYYPQASIMGIFTDLYPVASASPPDRKIAWHIEGVAPCRKLVLNYYHVGMFGNGNYSPTGTNCNSLNPTTFQIVLHESTGLIDVIVERKQCNATAGQGNNAIMGIQDFTRTKAVAVPGKNATVWTESNTAYRFTPSGPGSRYQIAEMLDMGGTVIATADTLTTVAGLLDIRFPNFCVPAGTTQYVVRTRFTACDNPATILESLDTITVNRLNSLGATATTTSASCGPPNGTITVNVPAGVGTPPYTYVLDGGAPVVGPSPYTFLNVSSGPHTIVVTDASGGCTSTINVNVSLTGTIPATFTTTATACAGVNNGTITITSAGGTGPYTFSLDGGPALPGTIPYTFTNVNAGVHTVQVNDGGTSCNTGPLSVTVTTGPGVTGTISATPTACTGQSTGTITVTALTGTAPFTWSLDGGPYLPGPSPYTFTNLFGGPHSVIIRDNFNCTVPLTINVPFGTGVTGNATATATSCSGVNDGTITATAFSGIPPFTWSLDGGPALPGASPYIFTGVAAGSHVVTITDNVGCSTPIIVPVTGGPTPTATVSSTATACAGVNNGTITISAVSIGGPYTFSLDGGAPVAGALPYTFTNVSAGVHNVVVTGAAGCSTAPTPIPVAAGAGVTGSATTTATSCNTATNGTITVTALSGSAPFTWSLDGGPALPGASPYTFTNVPAGTHNVLITDNFGCTYTENNIIVTAGPALTTTVSSTDVLCFGGATGVITVAVPVMGTPPYEYSLDGTVWQSSNIFSGLIAGPYTVYYRESNGCQGQQNITVNEPTALTASNAVVAVTCNGGLDGTITVTAGGGIPPYQYSIDGGANWQSNNIFTVGAGPYTITIRDANGCTSTQGANVTEPAALTASSVNTNASCNGGNDGMITVTANGGNPGGYQYSLDNINWQSSNVFNVAPNSYTVYVRDNLGCTTNFPAVVGLSSNLTFTPQVDPTICEGSSTPLNLVSNATVYTWTPSAGLSNPNIANPVANPTVTTQYEVIATLDRCSIRDTVIVNVNPAPVPDAGVDGFICFGQTYQLQGSGGVQYSWTPSTYLDNPLLASPTSSARETITYTLSILADANGCPSLVTDDMVLDVTPPVKVYTFPMDTIAYPGDQIQLRAVSAVPAANIFTWTPAINLDNPGVSNPTVTAGNIGDSLVYTVTAMSAAGCIGEGYVRLRVYKGPELWVPNAFTPNGDGKNETFYPFPVGIKAINYFRVYNRWGQLVFSSTTLYKGWDGKFNGTDQGSGTFVWMAQGIDKNNNLLTRQGTVTLIR